jgi:uncharacterized protein (DUF1499 family)
MLLAAKVLAVLGVLMLVVGPLGARFGVWSFLVGFALMGGAVLDALAAIIVGATVGIRTHQWGVPLAVIGVGALVIALPLFIVMPAFGLPPIHDITTDADDPPTFQALLPLRAASDSPPAYDGADAAAQQRRAYPDIQPIVVMAPAATVFDAALDAARGQGWQVVAADRDSGRIEAIASTLWFGFKDDVVIRLRPDTQAAATRVDVRSKSRVGVGDLGANARRIRLFVSALRERMPS